MSILIKGIDMPKCSNEDIMVVIRRDKAEVHQTGYKVRTVEAIQIPTPHGRLIEEHYSGELKAKVPQGVFIMYYNADEDKDRIIIEAEEVKRCITF